MAPVPIAGGAMAAAAVGTAALSASANSLNQFLEVPYDPQVTTSIFHFLFLTV